MKTTISHDGILQEFTRNGAIVRIVQSSSCSGCKIASHCNSSESKEKLVHVKGKYQERYNVGDKVLVCAAENVGMKAVVFAFVIPIIVMFAAMAIAYIWGGSEAIMGISALASLLPYYLVLYLMRGYFEKVITFYIK